MSEIRISSTDLARTIGEVLGRVRLGGDTFVIENNDRPVAMLLPYVPTSGRTLREVLHGWVAAGERDEDLAELLAAVGRSDAPADDPWGS